MATATTVSQVPHTTFTMTKPTPTSTAAPTSTTDRGWVDDLMAVQGAILGTIEPHWKKSWQDRVWQVATQIQVDRKSSWNANSSNNDDDDRFRCISFRRVPYLALILPVGLQKHNGKVATWIIPGNGTSRIDSQQYHRTDDSRQTQRDAQNLLGLGHLHEADEMRNGYWAPNYRCQTSIGESCRLNSDDLPINLWYTILQAIYKNFCDLVPAAKFEQCNNAIYVPPQHDSRLLCGSRTHYANGKLVEIKAGEWHQSMCLLRGVALSGKINWLSCKDDFVKMMHDAYRSAMLDALFSKSPIKREVAEQVLKQMTPITDFLVYLNTSNQLLLQWNQESGTSTSAVKLNPAARYYPKVVPNWLPPLIIDSRQHRHYAVASSNYLDDHDFGNILAWMDACNDDMLTIYQLFEASESSETSQLTNSSSSFPSLNDRFPDHTDLLTFRGRLAQTILPKTLISFRDTLHEIAETAEPIQTEAATNPEKPKRLRFLNPVAKIIYGYLPFPTAPMLLSTSKFKRKGFNQFA